MHFTCNSLHFITYTNKLSYYRWHTCQLTQGRVSIATLRHYGKNLCIYLHPHWNDAILKKTFSNIKIPTEIWKTINKSLVFVNGNELLKALKYLYVCALAQRKWLPWSMRWQYMQVHELTCFNSFIMYVLIDLNNTSVLQICWKTVCYIQSGLWSLIYDVSTRVEVKALIKCFWQLL